MVAGRRRRRMSSSQGRAAPGLKSQGRRSQGRNLRNYLREDERTRGPEDKGTPNIVTNIEVDVPGYSRVDAIPGKPFKESGTCGVHRDWVSCATSCHVAIRFARDIDAEATL